jgi:hypothetical protein
MSTVITTHAIDRLRERTPPGDPVSCASRDELRRLLERWTAIGWNCAESVTDSDGRPTRIVRVEPWWGGELFLVCKANRRRNGRRDVPRWVLLSVLTRTQHDFNAAVKWRAA